MKSPFESHLAMRWKRNKKEREKNAQLYVATTCYGSGTSNDGTRNSKNVEICPPDERKKVRLNNKVFVIPIVQIHTYVQTDNAITSKSKSKPPDERHCAAAAAVAVADDDDDENHLQIYWFRDNNDQIVQMSMYDKKIKKTTAYTIHYIGQLASFALIWHISFRIIVTQWDTSISHRDQHNLHHIKQRWVNLKWLFVFILMRYMFYELHVMQLNHFCKKKRKKNILNAARWVVSINFIFKCIENNEEKNVTKLANHY